MASKFTPNHAGIREYLLSGDLQRALLPHAVTVEERAKAIASRHVRTGDYLRSIHIENHRSTDRVAVRVVADDPKSVIMEGRYHVMGQAAG